jgi:hypothetical protein
MGAAAILIDIAIEGCFSERIPVRTVIGAPEPCPRLHEGLQRPASLEGYSEGRLLEDALADAHLLQYRDA